MMSAADEVRPVTVLAVDDQAVFLRAAHELIAATPGFSQVGEAASGPEAVALAVELQPDLVLLDVRMPGMDGIETAQRLLEARPEAVVVLISLDDVPVEPAAADLGVAAHLRKQDLSTHALLDLWATHGRPRATQ
jgi:DNA-binding NarL/FixJ family response regulator